mmetsp:Transcript_951/g.1837  ORF Transcript_951/g.1837 Transcript_951/m.1837 type:complete len:120 (+) Transcript_951:40-399(+)
MSTDTRRKHPLTRLRGPKMKRTLCGWKRKHVEKTLHPSFPRCLPQLIMLCTALTMGPHDRPRHVQPWLAWSPSSIRCTISSLLVVHDHRACHKGNGKDKQAIDCGTKKKHRQDTRQDDR